MDIIRSILLNKLIQLEVFRCTNASTLGRYDRFPYACCVQRVQTDSDQPMFALYRGCLPFTGRFIRYATLSEALEYLVSFAR